MGMQILTASSNCQSAVEAVADIKKILVPKEGKLPKFILVYYTEDFSETELHQAFTAQFPDVEITGIQVANGSFDRNVTAGFPEESLKVTGNKTSASRFSVYKMKSQATTVSNGAVFAMAFFTEEGAFGSVIVPVEEETDLKVSQAVFDAQKQAERLGVMPDLLLLYEIRVPVHGLRSEIDNKLGSSIPILGGGLPVDHEICSSFTKQGALKGRSFYVLTLMYLPCQVVVESHSTCECDDIKATITKADNCVITEIDHQPSADLFFQWIGYNTIGMNVPEMRCLLHEIDNNYFLGRQKSTIRGDISYDVSVLGDVTPERALFTGRSWNEQEKISLMHNDNTDLFSCFLTSGRTLPAGKILGTLHIMCLSFCIGTNHDVFRKNVVTPVRNLYGDKNFLVGAMYGEFGKDLEGGLILGNYTVSTVYFLEW